MQRSHKNKNHN